MTCSIEQICYKNGLNEGTVQFSCNSDGNKASVSISTKGQIELGFKSGNDDSAKLLFDKDGKLKLSISNKTESRTTNLN
jgi:hypothetical protein